MFLNDRTSNGKPDPVALVRLSIMQPLKNTEDPFKVCGRDANPVVLNAELPHSIK